jgi:hypothetical protein
MFYRFSLVAIAQYSSICVSLDARSIAIQNKQHPNFMFGFGFCSFLETKKWKFIYFVRTWNVILHPGSQWECGIMKTFVNLRASSLVEPLALTGAIVSTPINVSTINMQLTSCGRGIVIMPSAEIGQTENTRSTTPGQ